MYFNFIMEDFFIDGIIWIFMKVKYIKDSDWKFRRFYIFVFFIF